VSGSTQVLTPHIPFQLGQVVITRNALEHLEKKGLSPFKFLNRHRRNDWGDLCEEDIQANNNALVSGDQIFSSYHIDSTELEADLNRVWVITEHDRSVTTILLPVDY
jgi:hypothetical protein